MTKHDEGKMSRPECDRLNRELVILHEGEVKYQQPAVSIARQLVTDAERPLPDVLPQPPQPATFEWPASGHVDYIAYWQAMDRRGKTDWNGSYL